MVESAEMMRCSSRAVGSRWLVSLLALLPIGALNGEERAHVTLVDPAMTKCTVCHKNVETTHEPEALGQGCLGCHGFVKREDGTYLVDDRPAGDAAEALPGADRSTTTRLEVEAQDSGNVGSRSEPPGEPKAHVPAGSVAPAEPSRNAAAPVTGVAVGESPTKSEPGDLVSEQSLARYTAGLGAFRRGDMDAAFEEWEAMLGEAADQFTIQIAVDRLLESARLALEGYPDHALYVIPRGGVFYVMAGVFPSRASAAQGLARLPAELTRDGAFATAVRALPEGR